MIRVVDIRLNMNKKLTIELIPRTSWFTNLRSIVSKNDWDIIRRKCYKNAGYKCEICSGKGNDWPVECHEVWKYDDIKHIQKLIRVIALCPNCHQVKHIGLAQIRGKLDEAMKHFCKINKIDDDEAIKRVNIAFEKYRERSSHEWKIIYKNFIKNYKSKI